MIVDKACKTFDDNDLAYALTVNKWNEILDALANNSQSTEWQDAGDFAELYASLDGAELCRLLPDIKDRFQAFAAGMAVMLGFITELENKEATP